MIELITFGAIELRRDGVDVRSVLSQPKRLALLVYLGLAAPGRVVARDRLLALFWPESDPERARNALRQSLHFLRRSLGNDVLVSRGAQEVGIALDAISCDAVAFENALELGRLTEALELYRGELLPGFHLDDAPELERWIDERRDELARRATAAARTLSEREEVRGELAAAVVWAQRHVGLDPLSESAARRLMTLQARSGERARALEVFDGLVRRLAVELDLDPSPETVALADEIRSEGLGVRAPAAVAPAVDAGGADAGGPVGPGASTASGPRAAPGPPDPAAMQGPRALRRSRRPTRSGALTIAVVCLLAVGAVVLPRLRERTARPEPSDPAIAVMPFLDMSQEGGREYFSDGIAEELLNVLAQVPGLRVAARTSSFAFRSSDATADSIGRALRVTHLLEGSVRSDGQSVRVTVQLIEASSGFHVWSQTYDRELRDIFAVQDEISKEVVQRLQLDFPATAASAHGEPPDPLAHQLYLRGRHAWNRRTVSSIRTAIAYFEQAVAQEPGYGRAWAGLAEALVVYPQYAGVAPDEWFERAGAAARRAIALDPSLAEPHAALGLRFTYGQDAEAEMHYREALRLNPNHATAHHWYSIYLAERGRFEDQLREIRIAQSLDPLSPVIQANVGKALLHLRRPDEAVDAYRQLIAMEPGFGFGHAVLAEALSVAGRHEEAAAAAHRALEILGNEIHAEALASAGYALGRAGEREQAHRIAMALEAEAETPGLRPGAWGPAQVHAALGETDLALAWIERAVVGGHWGGRPDLPFFDSLHDDARFQEWSRRFDRR